MKLKHDNMLSNLAFNLSLRSCIEDLELQKNVFMAFFGLPVVGRCRLTPGFCS